MTVNDSLIEAINVHSEVLQKLIDRVEQQDEELAALNSMVTNLMHRTYGEDTDKLLGVKVEKLEDNMNQMLVYLFNGVPANRQKNIPQRLQDLEDQIRALYSNNDGQEILG